MKILLLEAYYGGSHKQWADQLKLHSKYNIQILSLPPRHWKWRMEGAAISFAQMVMELDYLPEIVLCSSMLDLASFKAFAPKEWHTVKYVHYMHENQFAYPHSLRDQDQSLQRDHHYGMIQYRSMIAADQICFNSAFNKDSFFKGLKHLLKKLPDEKNLTLLDGLKAKSKILSVGIQDDVLLEAKKQYDKPVFLWNHRWEHDKAPDLFFETLIQLKEQAVDFELIILGEERKGYPEIFDTARVALEKEISFFGYAQSRQAFVEQLQKANIMFVSSRHDFFGVSLLEAILAGCIPLLPNRLVYPEHLDPVTYPALFYDEDNQILTKLQSLISMDHEEQQSEQQSGQLMEKLRSKLSFHLWSNIGGYYDEMFEALID